MMEVVEDEIKSLNFLGRALQGRAIVARRGRSEYRSRLPVLGSSEGERVIGRPSRHSLPYHIGLCQFVLVRYIDDDS